MNKMRIKSFLYSVFTALFVAGLSTSLTGVYSKLPIWSLSVQILMLGTALAWLFIADEHRIKKTMLSTGAIGLPVAVYFVISIITSIASVNTHESLSQIGQFATYLVFALLAACLVTNEGQATRIPQIVLLLGVLMCIIGVYLYWGEVGEVSQPRMNSIFGNKNHFGGYLLLVLPLALALYFHASTSRELVAYGATSILFLSCFVLTYSRGTWMSLGFVVPIMAWLMRSLPLKKHLLPRAISILLLTAATVVLINRVSLPYAFERSATAIDSVYAAAIGSEPGGTLAPRVDYWQGAFRIMRDKPFTGTGLGTFGTVFSEYQLKPPNYSKYAHNYFLQTGAEMGVPGLLAGLWVFLVLGWICYRCLAMARGSQLYPVTAGLVVSLFASTLHNLVELDWYIPAISILFWAEVGLLLGIFARIQQPDNATVSGGQPPILGGEARATTGHLVFIHRAVIAFCVIFLAWASLQLGTQILIDRGKKLAAQSHLFEAEAMYRLGARLNPLDPEPHFLLADLYLDRFEANSGEEDLLKGIESAKRAVELSPRDTGKRALLARLYLAGSFVEEAMLDAAIEQLESIVHARRAFQAPYAFHHLGQAYLTRNRLDDAKRLYLQMLRDFPQGLKSPQPSYVALSESELADLLAQAHLALGNIYVNEGEPDKAIGEYWASIELQPQRAHTHFNLGVLFYGRGDFNAASIQFKQAMEYDPGYAPTHYYLGLCYRELGRGEAKEHFETALLLDPECEECAEQLKSLESD
jgi:tetratricopeptide (TPR) repeat protein/O-antigen ligase